MAKKAEVKEVVEVEASTTSTDKNENNVCIIVGTGKYSPMPKGEEYEVSTILANTLIEKGAATLKE